MEKIGNFEGSIHNADYDAPYLAKLIKSDSLIADCGRPKESLNGQWHYGVDQYDTCLRGKWFEEKYFDGGGRRYPLDYSFDTWDTMNVPSCWNTQSEWYFLYEGSMVYTRVFDYKNRGEKRVFIKFGGAANRAFVFLNGEYLGAHIGASTPFCVEVTEQLKAVNRIIVVVNNTRRRSGVPLDNTDWFNYGGLYRDVDIIRLPEAFIRDFTAALKPDGNFNKICVTVSIDGAESGAANLSIDELGIDTRIEITNGRGEAEIAAAPELWSPDNPKLYDVVLSFGEDSLSDRIGFREIKASGTEILLNGESVYLRGVCAHEDSVVNGKAVSEAEIRENYRLAKEMNCNFMRLAHYPHSGAAARIADEVGIMLWEEIPVYWAIDFGNKAVFADAENQLSELIIRDRNRASVVIWSVGNENADTDDRLEFMSALAGTARRLDPTRLVSAACLVDHQKLVIADRLAEYLDVIGINEYYGWYEPDFSKLPRIFENSRPVKPVIISEFGADARGGHRGTADELYTEDNQLDVYLRQIDTLGGIPYVRGTSPWILFDFRCPRRLHPLQNYYNLKGLVSGDKRHKKPAFYAMRDFYEKIREAEAK